MREYELLETVLRPPLPIDLDQTLWPLRRGLGDPCMRADPDGSWWRATRTPLGPVAARYWPDRSRGEVRVQAWGPGAAWAIEAAPDLVGAHDDLSGFEPASGPIRELHRTFPGLRITRSRAVFEAIVPSVIEQKIAGKAARRSYRELVLAWGEPAPGPGGLRVPPAPDRLAGTPYFDFHPIGIERRRAEVIRRLASRAGYLDAAAELDVGSAHRRLLAFPGVGEWTAAEVAVVALGDADAVSGGDYHLPHQVAWVLAGEPRGTDALMLELLEPYRGHRGRVLRLIGASGLGPPRRGPRLPIQSFRKL